MKKLLLLGALALSSLSAQEEQKLVFQPASGKTYKFSLESKAKSVMTPPGGEALDITNDSVMEYTMAVNTVEKGLEYTNEITNMKIFAEVPGMGEVKFDSDKPDEGIFAAMFGELVGSKQTITVNEEGEVIEEEKVDKKEAMGMDAMNIENIAAMIESSYKMFPDKSVSVGDTWLLNDEVDFGGGQIATAKATMTLEGYEEIDGHKTAKITFDGTLAGQMDMAGAKINMTSDDYKGTIWHDVKLNVTRKSVTKTNISLSAPGENTGLDIASDTEITLKLIGVK